ncbi:MAG: M28 family peptidase, partial [Cellulosilyticaceae bacterium]
MTMLSNKELELFKSILGCRQGGLKKSMEEFLVKLYGKKSVIIEKEYIVAIGDIPVGLVAHLDTVHKTPAYQVFYDKDENVLWSPQGLGADDRAGVYAIVELLTRDYKPTVIFTTDEEKGGLGASALVSDFPKPPFEVNYLIELDRQGGNDSVFYECANQDFERYINRFGFL